MTRLHRFLAVLLFCGLAAPAFGQQPVTIVNPDGSTVPMGAQATQGTTVPTTGAMNFCEGAGTDYSANTVVTDGQSVRMACDNMGRLLLAGYCDRGAAVGAVTTITDGSSTAAGGTLTAPGSGLYLEIRVVTIANTSATDVSVDMRDGIGGSVLWTFPVPAHGGVTQLFPVPRYGTANTAIAWDPSASATSIIISASGCKAK